MITAIRKQFRSPSFRLFWMILVGLFAVGLITPLLYMGKGGGPWALRVNGTEISFEAFARESRQQEQRISSLRSQYGKYADMVIASLGLPTDPRVAASQALIDSELLNQAGKSAGVTLHGEYVNQQMQDPAALQGVLSSVVPPYIFGQDGVLDQNLLREYLRNQGIGVEQFESAIEQALSKKALAELVGLSVQAPEFDLKMYLLSQHGDKKFFVATASLDAIRREEKKAEISNQELREFFDREGRESDTYWIPERRDATVWKFSSAQYEVDVSDDAVTSYYEARKGSEYLKEPAKVEVRHILLGVATPDKEDTVSTAAHELHKRLAQDPKQFSALAKEFSEDTESASQGGLLPALTRTSTDFDREFIKTAFLLKEDGAISGPIRTNRGYEILQRVNRKNAAYEHISQVKGAIRNKLARQQFREEFSVDLGRIVRRQRDGENVDEQFDALIMRKGSTPEKMKGVTRDGSKLAEQLFKLEEGDIGFYVEGVDGYVVRLAKVEKRHLSPFESVREAVRSDLYNHRAHKKMQLLLEEAQRHLLGADGEGKVTARKEFSTEAIDWISPEDEKTIERLRDRGFPVKEMMEVDKEGLVISHIEGDAGYLIKTTGVRLPAEGIGAEQKDKARFALLAHRANGTIEAFVASLRRHATIENHESIAISQ